MSARLFRHIIRRDDIQFAKHMQMMSPDVIPLELVIQKRTAVKQESLIVV